MQRRSFSGDLTYEIRIKDGDYVLAKGCATAGCIHDLYVHDQHRRKGYATAIANILIKECNANWLWCRANNEEAVALYNNLGFKITKIDDGYYKMSLEGQTQ